MSNVTGVDNVNRNLNRLASNIDRNITKVLTDIALDLIGKAQLLAPVDSGDLRGSGFAVIHSVGDVAPNKTEHSDPTTQRNPVPTAPKRTAIVGFTEKYALKQHEELSYNHPQGGQAKYLEEPFKQNLPKYMKSIRDEVKKST